MAKRGQTNLSLLVGVNKPQGISSHDVINNARRIFGERRIGHMGTLDPLASGILILGIGPAARLDNYLSHDTKTYQVRMVFGRSTNTDDAEGETLETCLCSDKLLDAKFAQAFLDSQIGKHEQIPPAYSAIKVNGVRAYKLARQGHDVDLKPRRIELSSVKLLGVGTQVKDPLSFDCAQTVDAYAQGRLDVEACYWDVELSVSKGTYIRSLVRDMAKELGCLAYVDVLHRTRVGQLEIKDCYTLEELESIFSGEAPDIAAIKQGETDVSCALQTQKEGLLKAHALDPVRLLATPQYRLSEKEYGVCKNGNAIALAHAGFDMVDNQLISLVYDGRLCALYRWDAQAGLAKSSCGFSIPVLRGKHERLDSHLSAQSAQDIFDGASIALGVFDGLHQGHQFLLEETKADAKSCGGTSLILTFDIDPDELFRPHELKKLMTNERRLSALAQAGLDRLIAITFSSEFSRLSPEAFLRELFGRSCPHSIHVGEDFRFGAGALGTVETLKVWAKAQESAYGKSISIVPHPLVSQGDKPISATRIRRLLSKGKLASARRLLGRDFRLEGVVVAGRGAGSSLGVKTANIETNLGDLALKEGVYAGAVELDGCLYKAAISVGLPPMFKQDAKDYLEAHILDFEGNVYGQTIKVYFVEYLRAMERFDSIEDLVKAITGDIDKTQVQVSLEDICLS